jgi:hypothetical protein
VIRGLAAVALLAAACASAQNAEPDEIPTQPLPTPVLMGSDVSVYPLTMMVSEPSLQWDDLLRPRADKLNVVDSLLALVLTERSPEVNWILPAELRRLAHQAPGMLPAPDQMGTSLLRDPNFDRVPDPLWARMRLLTGATGDRFALVPAALLYFDNSDEPGEKGGLGRAELTLVLVDVRSGYIRWRTVARGAGDDPWIALREALASLNPGLP